jgi:hypothetical protein
MSLICEERSVINEGQNEKRKIEMMMIMMMMMMMIVKKMKIIFQYLNNCIHICILIH